VEFDAHSPNKALRTMVADPLVNQVLVLIDRIGRVVLPTCRGPTKATAACRFKASLTTGNKRR
jgi:hypothetical protein